MASPAQTISGIKSGQDGAQRGRVVKPDAKQIYHINVPKEAVASISVVDVDVVVVGVRGQHRVDLADGERVDDEGRHAQVALQLDAAAHARHLVMRLHQRLGHGALAGAAPQIDAQVGAALALEPDAGASQPPHGKRAGLDPGLLDLFVQPGAPLREGGQDPGLPGDVFDARHELLR